jgi:hypothetical protein
MELKEVQKAKASALVPVMKAAVNLIKVKDSTTKSSQI